jgi:cysteinyl-tRNA synthetase
MARSTLGDVIDIHTGGEDLIFPHHECEIAQSRGATGQDSFANFWMHARFLLVDGGKMSKSKGNFYTARDVYDGKVLDDDGQPSNRKVHPAVLRYELIKSHYGSNMNFTLKGLQDSAGAVKRLQDFYKSLMEATGGEAAEVDHSHPIVKGFGDALADDLNMAKALGVILPWAGSKPDNPHEALGVLLKINHVLGVAPMDADTASAGADDSGDNVDQLCKDLDTARQNKDYDAADQIRQQIIDAGYDVKTSPDGTVAEKRLA